MINAKFLKALAVFVATIIGVGVFGLPYVALKAGFFIVVLYFLLMAGVAIAIHLFLGEVSAGTEGLHRLPGYVEKYLGGSWKTISLFVAGLAITGALLAYLIVGGEFLALILAPYFGGSVLIYTLLFFTAGAFLIWRGIGMMSRIEIFLGTAFLAIIILFLIKTFPFINTDYLKSVNFQFFAFPYGIVLFSLWGLAVVPELKEILDADRHLLKKVIISGILLSTLAYLLFTFAVLGASGSQTSPEAISGLSRVLGRNMVALGLLFGVIACFTSFLPLGLTLKKILWYDFGLNPSFSWLIACFLPLILFLAGFKKFITVISLTGAIAIGLEGIIVIFLYKEFLKKKFSKSINPLAYILAGLLILGIFFETYYFFWPK